MINDFETCWSGWSLCPEVTVATNWREFKLRGEGSHKSWRSSRDAEMPRPLPDCLPEPGYQPTSRPLFLAALWRHLSHLAGTQLSCDQNCFGGGRPTSIKNCERRINIILLLDAPGLVKPWEREEGRVVEKMFCCYCSSDSLCKLITLPT